MIRWTQFSWNSWGNLSPDLTFTLFFSAEVYKTIGVCLQAKKMLITDTLVTTFPNFFFQISLLSEILNWDSDKNCSEI